LARNDSRSDFMFDPYRFSDFGFRLDDHLKGLSQSIVNGNYHPRPLLTIDVPKSTLSVRPGSVLDIEDKVVLFAIACLIAPVLDKKLPETVYSWRVKKDSKSKELFEDHEILNFPFLKRRTIQRKIDFVEPWYGVWPRFISDMELAFEKNGFKYLVTSDIVSYFENLDLNLLRDLLMEHLPHQARIINFLSDLLDYWAWPAFHGASARRGIPQGNGVSSFLGNIYLLPLDRAFVSLGKKRELKYFRYMDDIKVFTKDLPTAREALFLMNEKLRGLCLNIQGSKTRILQDDEIREELFDDRLDSVNAIIREIQNKEINSSERSDYLKELKKHLRSIIGRKKIIRDKELRLFRRLVTGFTLLRHSGMVKLVLDQVERNPDSRLLNSAIRYLRIQERNLKKIAERLVALLSGGSGLFPYQEAHFFMTLRYMRNIPLSAWREARHRLKLQNIHWYVRQQAAVLFGLKKLNKREISNIRKLFEKETKLEVKRVWVQALAQLPREELLEVIRSLIFATEPKLQRLGRFFYGLLNDKAKGIEQVRSIFNQFNEEILLDRFYEIEVLSKARDKGVRVTLLENLKNPDCKVCRSLMKNRIKEIVQGLKEGKTAP
jgi:hypothetical protein